MSISWRAILLFLTVPLVSPSARASSGCKALRFERYFDGHRFQDHGIRYWNWADGKLKTPTAKPPRNCAVIDLTADTLAPGLTDAHTHMFLRDPSEGKDFSSSLKKMLAMGSEKRFKMGLADARSMLRHGFTNIRDLGNSGRFLDLRLRHQTRADVPRIFASGPGLVTDRGQFSAGTPLAQADQEYQVIHSPKEGVEAVERFAKRGVSWIKVYADNDPEAGGLTSAELAAIVRAAHARGLPVAAHSTNAASAKRAVAAGVDSIEHGYILNPQIVRDMAKKHIKLVATDFGPLACAEVHAHNPDPYYQCPAYRARRKARTQMALKGGVELVFGSDNYLPPSSALPDRGAASLDSLNGMMREGLSLPQVLAMATTHAADLLHRTDIGVLKSGARADVIAFAGNPLKTQRLKVIFVMKDGIVIKRPGKSEAK